MASSMTAPKATKPTSRPRVLVVDDDSAITEAIFDLMSAGIADCDLSFANSCTSARQIMKREEPFDLMLTDLKLPDGDGMSLVPVLRDAAPLAGAIVITGVATVDTAVNALRSGAVDFLPKPFTGTQLVERVRIALAKQTTIVKQERKLARLKLAVKRLNEARRMVSKKVDLLCNDLISAYGDLSRQMDEVRTQEGFRKYIENAADLEQLLCHSMDWLLRQLGYANCAVWLTGEDGEFQLGAYMKYTVPGDAVMTDALKTIVLPLAAQDGFVKIDAQEMRNRVRGEAAGYLHGQALIAAHCTYLGEPLAAVVFFRDATTAFKEEDCTTLQSIAPLFAVALAGIVNSDGDDGGDDHDDATGDIDLTASDLDDGTPPPPPSKKGPKKKKPSEPKNDADWWKRGEAPPF
jgi:FixJ family two-component response regulator